MVCQSVEVCIKHSIVKGISYNFVLVGVADGVGGWRQYGIDSSLFSSALMESCKRFVLEGGLESSSPINIIKAGFQDLTEHKEPLFGGYRVITKFFVCALNL